MIARMLGLCVLMLVAVAGHGVSFAPGFNCKHFSQLNHCSASWDSHAKACTCH
jgi:hypothetical protein